MIFCRSGIRETWALEGLSRWRIYITTTAVYNPSHKSIRLGVLRLDTWSCQEKNYKITHPCSSLSKTCTDLPLILRCTTILLYLQMTNVILQPSSSFGPTVNHIKKAQFGDFSSVRRHWHPSTKLSTKGFSDVNGSKSDIYTPRTKKKGRTD